MNKDIEIYNEYQFVKSEMHPDKAISELTNKGYPVITSLNMPAAKIFFLTPTTRLVLLRK